MSTIRRLALVAAAIAAAPQPANAQYYDCSFPLAWPFCIAGAAVATAGAIVTAPFRAYPYPYYGPAYYGYYGPGYYYPRHHHYRHYWRNPTPTPY
jgi:hypothetical protein